MNKICGCHEGSHVSVYKNNKFIIFISVTSRKLSSVCDFITSVFKMFRKKNQNINSILEILIYGNISRYRV